MGGYQTALEQLKPQVVSTCKPRGEWRRSPFEAPRISQRRSSHRFATVKLKRTAVYTYTYIPWPARESCRYYEFTMLARLWPAVARANSIVQTQSSYLYVRDYMFALEGALQSNLYAVAVERLSRVSNAVVCIICSIEPTALQRWDRTDSIRQ